MAFRAPEKKGFASPNRTGITTVEKKRREKCDKSKTITTDMIKMSLQDSLEQKAVTSLTFQLNR